MNAHIHCVARLITAALPWSLVSAAVAAKQQVCDDVLLGRTLSVPATVTFRHLTLGRKLEEQPTVKLLGH